VNRFNTSMLGLIVVDVISPVYQQRTKLIRVSFDSFPEVERFDGLDSHGTHSGHTSVC